MGTLRRFIQLVALLATFKSLQCFDTLFESATVPSNWDPATGIQEQGVAVTETHLAIGVQSDTVNGTGSGSVYLYTREKNSAIPNLPGTKVVSPESSTKTFGFAVALNHDFLVVSSQAQGPAKSGVFVFTLDGVFKQKFLFPSGLNNPGSMVFGYSLGINDDNEIAVGAFEHYSGQSRVYIFRYDGSTWSQLQELPMDYECSRFGRTVGITNEHVIAPCYGMSPQDRNGIFVYHKNVTTGLWVKQQFVPPIRNTPGYTWKGDGSQKEYFPITAAIHGHRIIAGEQDQYAYVYDLQNNTWVPTGILDGKQQPSFAKYLTFEGNVAIVGEPHKNVRSLHRLGTFHVFELNTTLNEWVEIAELTFNGAIGNNYYGIGAAKNGDLIFSAPVRLPSGVGALVHNLTGIITPAVESAQLSSSESPQLSTVGPSQTSEMGTECLQDSFTATWSKSSFAGATSFKVTLNDNLCNAFWENSTNFGIVSNITECGSADVTEEDKYVIHNNRLLLKVSYGSNGVIRREKTFAYNVACRTHRHINVTSSNGFNASSVSVTIDIIKKSEFEAIMNIFTTSTFISVASNPYNVGNGQPLYVSVDATSELYSFVVQDCYATPSNEPSDVLYSFFRDKCPLDSTFQALPSGDNQFRYKIDAFQFIAVTKSILLHCRLFLCGKNTTSADCRQECTSSRKRRETIDVPRSGIIDIKSQELVYKRMEYCKDVVCGPNAVCVNAYPAVCVCVEDYILVDGKCTKDNSFRINNMHLKTQFVEAYRDETSVEFLELSQQVRKMLLASIRDAEGETVIVNIKVFNPRPGSVIVDTIVATQNRSTHEKAFEEVKQAILRVNNTENEFIRIKKDFVPVMAIVEEANVQKVDYFYAVAIVVPLVLLTATVLIALQCYRKKKMEAKTELGMGERGVDNKTMELEGFS